VAEVKYTFTVDDITEENQDVPVELGTVEFDAVARLDVNEAVPDFSVRSLDGGQMNLVDFRGKYVLLTFYVVSGPETLNEEMAVLKRIQDDFSGDARFVMVGLTHGGFVLHEELAKKFIAEQELRWQHGFLDSSNYELMQTYKIQHWPQSLLIDPNGILLSNGLKGDELYDAVDRALVE
ncbi:MAG: TlpA family protein disulfide reductase, partial [Planctomycetota bacterium]